MNNQNNDTILAIDDTFCPTITCEIGQELKPIQKQFIESYLKHKDTMPVGEWLCEEMANSLPDQSPAAIEQMSNEIISTLKVQEEKKANLEVAIANGRSKESWFASDVKSATSHMTAQESAKYLQNLDDALHSANESLSQTIRTQSGAISQNPQLDGFIAEQYHAQTFNLNAEATGSPYRAKVLEPNGTGYAKNSVDIVIVDDKGNIVRRYQSKYCKNAEATAKAFEQGDYRGQRKLVPEGQEQGITKKTATVLEAPDGTTSNPLSKEQAKQLQEEAQSGSWNDLNWNDYKAKDLAIGIGKQAGQAALLGAAVGVGANIAQKVMNGEEIDGGEIVESAISSGADFGIKAAAAGAIKVGVEKNILPMIPKGTPASTIASVAHVAVENVKIVGEMATGKLTVREGLDKMEQTTVSTVAGMAASTKGAAIGAAIGTVLGPVGSAVGGFIGGTIAYVAGSKIGETVVKVAQKAREVIKDTLETVGDAICSVGNAICSLFGF